MDFFVMLAFLVTLALQAVQMLLFVRVIYSLFAEEDDSSLGRFLYHTTEPFVFPMRRLLEKTGFLEGVPIDFSFLFTYIAITLINLILPSV